MNRRLAAFLAVALAFGALRLLSSVFSFEYSGAHASVRPPSFVKETRIFQGEIAAISESSPSSEGESISKDAASRFPSEIPPGDGNALEALCALKRSGTSVPTWGSVRIHISKISSGPAKGDFVAWIKSDSCDDDSYSVLQFSLERGISREIDCRNTSLTELMRVSGEQSEIRDVESTPGMRFFAISGNGYFTSICPDRRFRLTRDGAFSVNGSHLVNDDGCLLLNQDGDVFRADHEVDSRGCDPLGECIGVLDPFVDDIDGLSRLDSRSFMADSTASLSTSSMKKERPHLFKEAAEDLSDPERGATGIRWRQYPRLNLADIPCD